MTSSSRNRPRLERSGFHRSPSFRTRAGTFSSRKSSMWNPRSTSSQLTGVDTPANSLGRTEYTDARVRPHAFWL